MTAPASLQAVRRFVPGKVGPATSAGNDGIPPVALAAYQRAAAVIDDVDHSCHLQWPLLAAIGRVESDHGRHAGSLLSADGEAQPAILGRVLDGRNGTSRIVDTDGGLYDRNTSVDRAVGPMQFIPSTWMVVGVDADGDGRRDPQDVDDAALGAAVYLCSGPADLATASGADSAVYRYNHSSAYVDLVTRIAREYAADGYASKASSGYAPVLPALGYQPAPTKVTHHHTAAEPHVGTSAPPSGATSSGTHSASTGHQEAPTSGAAGPPPPTGAEQTDPVTQVVATTQSTVTVLLNESQHLLNVLLPTP